MEASQHAVAAENWSSSARGLTPKSSRGGRKWRPRRYLYRPHHPRIPFQLSWGMPLIRSFRGLRRSRRPLAALSVSSLVRDIPSPISSFQTLLSTVLQPLNPTAKTLLFILLERTCSLLYSIPCNYLDTFKQRVLELALGDTPMLNAVLGVGGFPENWRERNSEFEAERLREYGTAVKELNLALTTGCRNLLKTRCVSFLRPPCLPYMK